MGNITYATINIAYGMCAAKINVFYLDPLQVQFGFNIWYLENTFSECFIDLRMILFSYNLFGFLFIPTLYIHKYIHKWVFIYLKLNLLLDFAQQMFFLQCAFLNINDDMHPYKQNVQQSPYLWITLYFKGKWILKLKIAPGGRETIAMVGIQTLAYFSF